MDKATFIKKARELARLGWKEGDLRQAARIVRDVGLEGLKDPPPSGGEDRKKALQEIKRIMDGLESMFPDNESKARVLAYASRWAKIQGQKGIERSSTSGGGKRGRSSWRGGGRKG